jgi:AcrR family transcriptional regulator
MSTATAPSEVLRLAEANEGELNDEDQRRQEILQAASRCFVQLGISKTSIQDVARAASISRGTVYRYFDDRQHLVDATIEYGAQLYYRDAREQMDQCRTLSEQMAALARVTSQSIVDHRTQNRLAEGDSELMMFHMSNGSATLARTTRFLTPFVEAAQERGEVGRDVDAAEASEWLARALLSISLAHASVSFDITDSAAVAAHFERFAVSGLR